MILMADDLETPENDLARLIRELNDLEALPLIDQAKALRTMGKRAEKLLAQYRGAVFDRLAGPGRPMTIAALTGELGVQRSKVDDAIKAHKSRR